MKLIDEHRPLLRFIGLFLGLFVLLQLLYSQYLMSYEHCDSMLDPFTHQLALQVQWMLQQFTPHASIQWTTRNSGYWIWVNGHAVARIIEGCNAARIMALFVAFVVAFAKGWRRTFLFAILGVLGIHIFNLFRISALALGIAAWPQSAHALHEYLFPMLLYGFVMALWVYWVRQPFLVKNAT